MSGGRGHRRQPVSASGSSTALQSSSQSTDTKSGTSENFEWPPSSKVSYTLRQEEPTTPMTQDEVCALIRYNCTDSVQVGILSSSISTPHRS